MERIKILKLVQMFVGCWSTFLVLYTIIILFFEKNEKVIFAAIVITVLLWIIYYILHQYISFIEKTELQKKNRESINKERQRQRFFINRYN